MPQRYYPIILVVFSLAFFILGLADSPLTDPDETFYAQTSREMLEAGEWVTPILLDKVQFEKPPFCYWLIMISYKIFGVTEFAARFPSMLFAVMGVIGVYILGRTIYSPLCGLFSGVVMATSAGYAILSKAVVTDMVLTVAILYTIVFFILHLSSGKKRYFYLAAISAATAVLTKGPIGIFIPFIIIIPYFLSAHKLDKIKNMPVISGTAIFLIVSLPWYVIVTSIHGSAFLDTFFGFHNITRFLVPEHRIGSSPFFYFPVLLIGFLPWSFFLPFAIWFMFKMDKYVSGIKKHKLLLMLYALTVFAFFSLSRTKLVTYIFPLYPAISLITGRLWEERRIRLFPYLPIISIIAFVFFFYVWAPGIVNTASSREFGVKIHDTEIAKGALGGEDDHRWGIAFYSGRKDIQNIHEYNSMIAFFKRHDEVWAVVQEKHLEQLKKQFPDMYLETILKNGEYVLVTNKRHSGN